MKEEEVNEEEDEEGHRKQLEFLCVEYTGSVLLVWDDTTPSPATEQPATTRAQRMLTRAVTTSVSSQGNDINLPDKSEGQG
jgi:hypothetical protein